MKKIRKPNEPLEEMLRELQIGDNSIYDSETNYEITKVPCGFIYKNEYVGMCFVPDFLQEVQQVKPQPTMSEKKIEKPARKVVTK